MTTAPNLSCPIDAPYVMEMWLDYVCPFSAKAFNSLFLSDDSGETTWQKIQKEYSGKIRFVFRNQIQPWHPQSTMLHEISLVVAKLFPEKFFDCCRVLFSHSMDYYDVNTYNKSRMQIYEDLTQLIQDSLQIDKSLLLSYLVRDTSDPNAKNNGNKVTNDLKKYIRLGRTQGIHISPTMTWNGIIESSHSSSWQWQDYKKFLDVNVDKNVESFGNLRKKKGILLHSDGNWDENEIYDSIDKSEISSPINPE